MALVSFSNIGKSFGASDIFSGLSASIPHKARIALVGPNGIGKTTLLNIIVGLDDATHGSVHIASGARVGYLPQRPELAGEHTLWEEMERVFAPLKRMEAQLADFERQMADPNHDDDLLERYGNLQARYEHAGGFSYDHKMRMVLTGLGFSREEYDRPLPILSGGQRTRALLGRLLLEDPDLLVMDEPTNHLDISAVEWLEGFLRGFSGAVLMVSHDRYFMDRTVNTIWEMDWGRLEVYNGSYSHYVQQRDERHERLFKEYEAQQEFIQKEMDYIRKNMGRQRTSQARGKLRRLETLILGKAKGDLNRLERALRGDMSVASGRIDGPQGQGLLNAPKTRHQMHIELVAALRSGDKVLMTYDLGVGYPDGEVLFTAPDITLYRGEIAAVIGPNGAGKSTLLKTLLGRLDPKHGRARLGAGVQIGYFAQAHEELNPANSVMDEILTVRQMQPGEARNYLAKFLFRGDDVFRPISTLSGGERGRVALAKLSLSGANLLLLDEPTNHLDIPSQEILEAVIEEYDGTILMVSHDRYLIDALATQIWAVQPGEMTVFEGSYEEYVAARDGRPLPEAEAEERADVRGMKQQRQQAGAAPQENGQKAHKKRKLSPHKRQQRINLLEDLIHELEAKLSDLNGELSAASADGNVDLVRELGEDYAQTEQELESALAEWEALLVEE